MPSDAHKSSKNRCPGYPRHPCIERRADNRASLILARIGQALAHHAFPSLDCSFCVLRRLDKSFGVRFGATATQPAPTCRPVCVAMQCPIGAMIGVIFGPM